MGSCYNTTELSVPIEKVWETICDFHDLSWASGVITSLEIVGDKKGNETGAMRVLNDAFHETLKSLDPENHTFSYQITDGPGPLATDAVDHYIGVVKLSESGGRTLVEWSSSFESSSDDEVAEFCNPIYQALLSALKSKLS
ncbi:SRPBCC family protein [Vibrio sp. ZSDZ34]|jgi:carbon monoxide dehydrogenase subunit G|uniref:SRPBCC family protein n=1 Tax=Vibrio gelatinilyticus TaxID=2893468 RepID=A0A9X1WAM3_9VIBR|nr:SRPBCC family protein [Vibrio gelatinilyticus]MCJ2376714.1 SRPBCC family protein [Vibrio gelatinilyticus]